VTWAELEKTQKNSFIVWRYIVLAKQAQRVAEFGIMKLVAPIEAIAESRR
jgi:hypothetical protein